MLIPSPIVESYKTNFILINIKNKKNSNRSAVLLNCLIYIGFRAVFFLLSCITGRC